MFHYKTERPVDLAILKAMNEQLVHRGPDDDGYYCHSHVGLAQRRLSIIDLAGGHQPLANEDSTVWITYNGEFYTYREWMRRLVQSGHTFRTQSDTEVIVHAYEEWGEDFVKRLNGMFAFALWDEGRRKLMLARDPFGIKPLYYWFNEDGIAFSSEIKAFLAHPEFQAEINYQGLDQYLTYQFVPSPETIFKGVYKLQPGHFLTVSRQDVRTEHFSSKEIQVWKPSSEQEAVERLQVLIEQAVRRQMVSDVPVGALLSGGVDSATVVAIMQQLAGLPVQTFTVGFEGNFEKNELISARETARMLGTEHHETVINSGNFLDAFCKTIWHMDEPISTPSEMAMYYVSQTAAQSVKVVLTGQGADEPWAGYRRYEGEKIGKFYRQIPASIRDQLISPLANKLPRAEYIKRSIHALGVDEPVKRFTGIYSMFTPELKERLYKPWMKEVTRKAKDYEPVKYWQSQVAHLTSLAQQLFVETRLSLPDNLLLYGDKMAMASSLEARVPLLDPDLIDFVESLPEDYRLKGMRGHKYLYKKAIHKWLPDEILNRPKIGFATPIDTWFQSEITTTIRERLTAPGSASAKFFDPTFIGSMIDLHASRREDYSRPLFGLLVFEQWYDNFIRQAPVLSPRNA